MVINNGIIICFGILQPNYQLQPNQQYQWDITLPTTYVGVIHIWHSKIQTGGWGQFDMGSSTLSMSEIAIRAWNGWTSFGLVNFRWFTIGY